MLSVDCTEQNMMKTDFLPGPTMSLTGNYSECENKKHTRIKVKVNKWNKTKGQFAPQDEEWNLLFDSLLFLS
jgi:hypothetical protein